MYVEETLLLYKADLIILTNILGKISMTRENFSVLISLINRLHGKVFIKIA